MFRIEAMQQAASARSQSFGGEREVKVDVISTVQQPVVNGARDVPLRVSPPRKTTAELEAQHEQLDAILRDLLSHDPSSNCVITKMTKTAPPRNAGAVTETTETVTTWEALKTSAPSTAVTVVTETIERPAQEQPAALKESAQTSKSYNYVQESVADSGNVSRRPILDRAPTPPTTGQRPLVADHRNYVSDSEDPLTWLDEQQARMRSTRRSGTWRERTVRERQLVAELQSAQNALATIRASSSTSGLRPRTHSESDGLDRNVTSSHYRTAPLDRSSEYSDDGRHDDLASTRYRSSTTARRTSETSGSLRSGRDGYDVDQGHFVSGIERPPYTTQQTVYTFSVGPQRTGSLEYGLSSNYSTLNNRTASPGIPDRKESSREAVQRSRTVLQGQTA